MIWIAAMATFGVVFVLTYWAAVKLLERRVSVMERIGGHVVFDHDLGEKPIREVRTVSHRDNAPVHVFPHGYPDGATLAGDRADWYRPEVPTRLWTFVRDINGDLVSVPVTNDAP